MPIQILRETVPTDLTSEICCPPLPTLWGQLFYVLRVDFWRLEDPQEYATSLRTTNYILWPRARGDDKDEQDNTCVFQSECPDLSGNLRGEGAESGETV